MFGRIHVQVASWLLFVLKFCLLVPCMVPIFTCCRLDCQVVTDQAARVDGAGSAPPRVVQSISTKYWWAQSFCRVFLQSVVSDSIRCGLIALH